MGLKLIDGPEPKGLPPEIPQQSLHFRPARLADAELLRQWSNDPEVQAVSFSHHFHLAPDHRDWLQQKLNDAQCLLWIAEIDSAVRTHVTIGQVQIDIQPTQTAEISLTIDQRWRGQGWGKQLIKQAVATLFRSRPVQQILAQVRPSNVASMRAFQHAGFRKIAPTTVHGKLAIQWVMDQAMFAELDSAIAGTSQRAA